MGSGEGFPGWRRRRREETPQIGDGGLSARLSGCLNHTDESRESLGAALVLRAVGDFAGDHRRSERSLRPVVGRLEPLYAKETKQVAMVLVQADTVLQSLIVIVLQAAVPQVKGESVVDLLDLELVVGRLQIGALVVKLYALLEHILQA